MTDIRTVTGPCGTTGRHVTSHLLRTVGTPARGSSPPPAAARPAAARPAALVAG
ncbi:hypothetical protein EDD39_7440 [Kitasatospora cineracea]|uniref:Uncharacterized protein n=1 Tax=Kitasatospora cineracea TaxID=88074 RepID=A0A8G1UAC4_9ACTN|nr:hypothetical protein EDD39_7440 [Kitasatospora cineracea]